ncbi:MAG: DUF2281 domain-containing protein [bacterium]
MTTAQKLSKQIQQLPEPSRKEVLNFVEFLLSKKRQQARQEDLEWFDLSLASALRDLEEDANGPTYTESDLIEKWQ